MTKYILKRLLHGIFSIVIVILIVMMLIFGLMNRQLIFAQDPVFNKMTGNQETVYKYNRWKEYGYLDYVPYAEYLQSLLDEGKIDENTHKKAVKIGANPKKDSELAKQYIDEFTKLYESKGFKVIRIDAPDTGRRIQRSGNAILFATRDKPLFHRLYTYFARLISIDNIHYAKEDIEDRGLTFTWHDPYYQDGRFAPAVMGNGTQYKYLLYVNNEFPYIHQNLITINLGRSFVVNRGVDVFTTMTKSQGTLAPRTVTYPTGLTERSADDLHSATYQPRSREASRINVERFDDDYTVVNTFKAGKSKLGYSFIIGIIATAIAYGLGIPIGIAMARHKDGLFDKISTVYIVFIIAVPSLAYIILFKALGGKLLKLPTTFDMDSDNLKMYFLPIISLALPSIANLMKWTRRYMIDQMNSDYVKFARAEGFSESQIFRKHVLKNAIIPITHGIPGSILFAMTGAIITERVYVVPGAGNLLTTAINAYDNYVIVGVTLFYATLSVVSLIMGDILMSLVDPRITYTKKAR